MICKAIKYGLIGVAGVALLGGAIFGSDVFSYISSSCRAMRAEVKDNVPIEFELRRARDLVDDLVPEMHACVRQIAMQEVEIGELRREIEQAQDGLDAERGRVEKLRDALKTADAEFTFAGIRYGRDQVKEDLARRFDLLKEAEVVLGGKKRLLQNRERSLAAAVQTLERTRSQKSILEGQIAALDSQHQLIQAASSGTDAASHVDTTKLAQTERLIAQIKKQLDVAERVLAHESRFIEPIVVDALNEKELVSQVDEHLAGKAAVAVETSKAQD
jgi:chromosome segregation ATPase